MNDYPLLNLFWTMLWFFLFVAWIYLLIVVVTDIFRSDDLSGWGKALWVLFVVIVPWLGILVYLIARGDKMSARAASDYQRRDEEMRAYVREAAGTSGPEHGRRADQARGAARFGHDHRGRVRAAESQTPRLRAHRQIYALGRAGAHCAHDGVAHDRHAQGPVDRPRQ